MKDSHTFYGDYVTSGYQVSNPMIGYSARTLAKSYTSLRKKNGKTLYDVVYSIDKNGWRITPRSLNDTDAVVVFFGDSFTFGEGVDDKDTFAYQFSLKSSLKVYNFGYHGYGPHQMLRMLETGYIKHILEREGKAKSATLFVYTSLPAHVDRAAGRSSWDKNGPRYDLDSFGNAAFSGSFSSGALNPIIRILHTSELYQLINSLPQRLQLNNEAEDIARFAAIIKRSEKMVSETFAAKFVFIHWDCPYTSGNAARYADRISTEIGKNKNVLVHRITSSLPELCEPSNYIKEDGHPNSAGHGNYADFLLKELGYRSGNK